MNAALPPRVVVAVSPDLRPRMRAILPACELHFVDTGAELQRALGEERCDMLILGVHFDEPADTSCPVVFVGRRMARDELGAHDFIDLVRYPDDALGNARLQEMLEHLIVRERT